MEDFVYTKWITAYLNCFERWAGSWDEFKMLAYNAASPLMMVGIRSVCHGQNANVWNSTDLCVWGWGYGVEVSTFCIRVLGNGILSLTLCPGIMMVLWIDPKTSCQTFSMIGKWPKVDRSLRELYASKSLLYVILPTQHPVRMALFFSFLKIKWFNWLYSGSGLTSILYAAVTDTANLSW